jgi:hypothetical protein
MLLKFFTFHSSLLISPIFQENKEKNLDLLLKIYIFAKNKF